MGRTTGFVCLAAALSTIAAPSARASLIQTPFISARDAGLLGHVVASPSNGGSILLVNPAGVVGEEATKAEVGLFTIRSEAEYENPEIDYNTSSSELVAVPSLWVGTGAFAPWHVGVGL